MRTLQRPRKNKPSKRQVNHRRFLHNMIHRKFAEIEAANHQLASALFSTDKSQSHLTAKPSETDYIPDQSKKHSKNAIDKSINTDKPEAPVEQQEDVCDLWTLDTLMKTQVTDSRGTNPRTEKALKNKNRMEINTGSSIEKDTNFSFDRQQTSTDLESLTQMTSSLLEDSVSTWIGSIERMRTNTKPLITKCSDVKPQHTWNDVPELSPPSPVISLLSLDLCDLEIQMLIDADHATQTQDSLQRDMVDSFDLYCSENQDVQIYDSKCTMAEWIVDDEERCVQNDNTRVNCLDLGYDMDNLTGSAGGFSPQEFENDLEINPMLGNSMSNLDQKAQELSVLGSQETQRRIFHHDQENYYTSQSNIPEDHFSQFAPCMMTNRKDAGYLATGLSVSDQMVADCIGSSHILDHQLDCQSNRIQFDNWEQQSEKSTYKNYSQILETYQHHMSQDTNMKDADKNLTHNRTGSGLQGTIMDGSCVEGFYDKGESSYLKFRGNRSYHNFEGVARSFPATIHKTHPTPILTPPLDDDWLFSNIVAEGKSMTDN
ncbi:hypothetical protein IRJ41_018191 [Triplophysa rosa]|uniref:Uncharacterized protein n=1 Tax=Triplophysa rosa TaxID=992332 RepID=A0A9W7WRN3_TRIRA|nr:hypothetical protein IRJ41_018191 [Triplophysa rosa]